MKTRVAAPGFGAASVTVQVSGSISRFQVRKASVSGTADELLLLSDDDCVDCVDSVDSVDIDFEEDDDVNSAGDDSLDDDSLLDCDDSVDDDEDGTIIGSDDDELDNDDWSDEELDDDDWSDEELDDEDD